MGRGSFVHLHTHSEYSLLDGASRIEELCERAAAFGMPAIALTDHGAMFGALEFYETVRRYGLKPIVGVEAYVAPGSRFDRAPGENEEKYRHLTLLARDETGYRNLLRIVTDASIEGFYHRPRTDKDFLAAHAQGLVALSGCLASEVARLLLAGQRARARQVAAAYRDIFGPEGFYLEVQDHGLPEQRRVNPQLLELSRETGIPLVATNDIHYTVREHARPHDVLLCIQQQKVQSDTNRLRFDTDEFYLKSPEEMRRVFADLPGAVNATLEIAESVELLPELERALVERRPTLHLPRFDPPEGKDLDAYLRELVYRGAEERYGGLTQEVRDRIEAELAVITRMGFSSYFLIVWDLIRFAREHGIRVGPGRGSAAGSVVSYCLRITDLDPLAYGLIFERFLNPERVQMPDIDVDFDERRRDEVIRYVAERYGADQVAQIITFQTIKGKQGIRDAARVLGFPAAFGDRLAKMFPPAVLGREFPIDQALELSPELREAYEREPEAREVIDTARALEGLRREDSVHAAGVVIADAPLVSYLPLKLAKDSRDDSRRIVTQFDMHGVEKLGLLKMDFLGLRNLSVIEDTVAFLRQKGVEVDIDHVPLDDEETYRMLRRGDTTGVFQLEGSGMRALIRQLQPDRFEDLMALVALYRPGPLKAEMHVEYAERKHGRKPVNYPHPDLRDILAPTYGIIVYQEQVMQIAVRMAGYSMGEADLLRKAMGKKIREELVPHQERFIRGAVERGYPERVAREVFDLIVPFADYGFNASHACAYAYVAYQTAYLKAHYPVEYMAALLTSVRDDKDKKPFYLNAARLMGIRVLPPDVNESLLFFTPTDGDVRYGLAAVRNVGEGVVEQVLRARAEGGPYRSFTDFCRRVDVSVLNKKCLESLILAGAFDSLGYTRRGLLEGYQKVLDPILADRRAEAVGQGSFFGGEVAPALDVDESVLAGPEFEREELLRYEKEMLGQFVTDHPLLAVREQLAAVTDMEMSELGSLGDGDVVTVAGIVGQVARRFTRKGEPYAVFRLEDLTGGVTVVCFPSLYEKAAELVAPDRVLLVRGRADLRGRELQLVALELTEPDLGTIPASEAAPEAGGAAGPPEVGEDPLVIDVPLSACTSGLVAAVRRLLGLYPGELPVVVRLVHEGGADRLRLADDHRVDGSPALLAELARLLGPGAARLERPPASDRPAPRAGA
ncbi:MAG TPA: DNA polymerase III subunit alpha [Actinomycetota bacterium]|nr:DNA polymerase III subunit alpha [Actinomycetota bacterium]